MNLISADPTAPPPPPPPPQPPRSSFSCDRHPAEQFTGFCPSCLCERLTSLDNSSSNTPTSSRRPSSASAAAAAAIKSLFSSSNSKAINFPPPAPPPRAPKPAAFAPQLRRTQSFSASKDEALGLASFEPQRKSCDVRVRNTLWSLFSLDVENKAGASATAAHNAPPFSLKTHQNPPKPGSSVANKPVLEEIENVKSFRDSEIARFADLHDDDDNGGSGGDEIRSIGETHFENLASAVEVDVDSVGVFEDEVVSVKSLKPMKDHIDLHSAQGKKNSGGGLWAAASVFSKKWQKWRQKHKSKKQSKFATLPVEKPISRQYRETQSEIADYGFGRRSCDTDPRFSLDAGRFSLDAGRISVDDPRHSFEEPRASWDGLLAGRRSFSRMAPMVSVLEDDPQTHHSRPDMHIPVEEHSPHSVSDAAESVPGGSSQTKEYYSDSSSRRRKSLDRSSFIRKTAAAVVAEIDELKTTTTAAAAAAASNARVSPTVAADYNYFHGAKLTAGENDWRNSNSNSSHFSGTFEGFRNNSSSISRIGDKKETKKWRGWRWRIWGYIHRRSTSNEYEDDEKFSRANGVDRSYSESWHDLNDARNGLNRNVFRSNSTVSWRSSNQNGGSFGGSGRRPEMNMNTLERNRSSRHPVSQFENGLLRFYLAPVKGSRRLGGVSKIKANAPPHSIARSVLRLY